MISEKTAQLYKGYVLNELAKTKDISIPEVQRGLVWNPVQVELLWDSILRGFPIGSLILYSESGQENYSLIDGQQRFNAIKLGFQENDGSKLWIDLIKDSCENTYTIRYSSKFHPWGFIRSDNKFTPTVFSAELRRKALVAYFGEGSEEINVYKDKIPFDETWPCKVKGNEELVQESCPVPLSIVLSTFFSTDSVDEFCSRCSEQIILCKYWNAFNKDGKITKEFLNEKLKELFSEIKKLKNYAVSCIIASEGVLSSESSMTTCFERITSAGTQISTLELDYSAIKVHWKDIKINEKGIKELCEVNKFVRDYQLAVLAFRLAFLINEKLENDFDENQSENVGKWKTNINIKQIIELRKNKKFVESVKKVFKHLNVILKKIDSWLEDVDNNGKNAMPVYLKRCIATEDGSKTRTSDIYLLLMYFAFKASVEKTIELDSKYVISLSLFLRWFAKNGHSAAKEIYNHCTKYPNSNIKTAILTGICNSKVLNDDVTFIYRLEREKFMKGFTSFIENGYEAKKEDNPTEKEKEFKLFYSTWEKVCENEEILLYRFTDYLGDTFPKYTEENTDLWETYNKPWDIDHIVPYSWFNRIKGNKTKADLLKTVRNFIGNKAPIPFEINRSKNDKADWDYYREHKNDYELIDEGYLNFIDTLTNKDDYKSYVTTKGSKQFIDCVMNRTYNLYYKVYSLLEEFSVEKCDFDKIRDSAVNLNRKFFLETILPIKPRKTKIYAYDKSRGTIQLDSNSEDFYWTIGNFTSEIETFNDKVCIKLEFFLEKNLPKYWIGLGVPDGKDKDNRIQKYLSEHILDEFEENKITFEDDNDYWYISLKETISYGKKDIPEVKKHIEELIEKLRNVTRK